jgi:hypothetical protein
LDEIQDPRKENSSSRTDIPPQQCFALEQVQTNQEKYSIGNIIGYVGVSVDASAV